MSNLTGIINGRYYIIEAIGRGGMTTVYKALDVQTEQEVALKVLAPYLVMDPVFRARFKREIKILQGFDHPNIVPVIDHGEHEGAPYLVMPFFPYGTLADRLRSGPITSEECGIILNDISYALEYEHNRGIVHRDIKPSNILLDKDGRAYLSDFDLVYMQDASQNLTGSAVIGTPAYMSPEQCNSGPIDARSDQYSLAIVLFQLVTGHLPFYADTPIAIALQQINEPLPSPRDFNPDLPEPIEYVLQKALSKDPNKRYPTIIAFNQAFQKALRISIIATGANGSWTAKYYEITQVLNRIQSKAKGWFSQSVLTKRYTLIVILLLLFIIPGAVFTLFRFASDSSDTSLEATIAAIYTGVAQQGAMSTEGGFLETSVAGTLEALRLESEQQANSDEFIPITGNDGFNPLEFPGEVESPEPGTVVISSSREGQSTPSPSPAGLTSSSTPEPQITLSSTPTPTVENSQTIAATTTRTATPSKTPTPSITVSPTSTSTNTPLPSSTEDVCANITLGNFNTGALTVSYTLTNNSSRPITISTILLDWPTKNQRLDRVKVGSTTVWNVGDDEPPTLVTGVGEEVTAGASIPIYFTFKRAAASSGYSLTVTFSNGCEKSISIE